MIRMLPVNCEYIRKAGYDPISKILVIRFKNGSYYSYKNVSNWVFYSLYNGDYPGIFFYERIRGQYEYSKISESELRALS